MTSHPEAYVATQIPRDRMRELHRLRPWRFVVDLMLNWATICLALAAIAYWDHALLIYPVALTIIASRQHAIAILAHEGTHRLAFKSRWLNDFISEVFCAWPLGAVIENGYRGWHYKHHRSLGTDADPELYCLNASVYSYANNGVKRTLVFLCDLCGFGAIGLLKFAYAIMPKYPRHTIAPILFWCLVLVVAWALGALWCVAIWLICLFTVYWAIFRVRTWTEHVGAGEHGPLSTHRFSSSWILRYLFFPHNTYMHYEHHLCPAVPYYNLPKLRQLLPAPPLSSAIAVIVNRGSPHT